MEKAQKGDLIRIVDVPNNWVYKRGEIFEVIRRKDGNNGVEFKLFIDGVEREGYALDTQYVIHRKAGEESDGTITQLVDTLFEGCDEETGVCEALDLDEIVRTQPFRGLVHVDGSDADDAIETDAVNPQHYKQGRVEVIDVIEDAVAGAEPFEAVLLGNVLKYTLRYRNKNGVEDLRKSQWYLAKLIALYDAKLTQ